MNWITIGITLLIAFGLHSFDINRLEKKHAVELLKQSESINRQCTLAKAITTKVSDELQNNLTVLDADYSTLNSLLPETKCDISTGMDASPVTGFHETAAGQKFNQGIGRAFEPTRVTAIVRKGEKYRVQLKACQMWANDVWEASLK